ncbi:unnamed protein product [Phytomonas sp. Hart1]|nr:unnamed protein product [Phytomonas sp. Hart1]|eukprot:CCW67728.1 unnamed protein product [Phytomonas sp. isolate Hart1]
MRLLHTSAISPTPDCYILDGCLCNGEAAVVLSTSQQTLRLYDTHTSAFLFDLVGHTGAITDVVATPANPNGLYSAQADAGVLVSDLRQAKVVQCLTGMSRSGGGGNSIAITPSARTLAVATDGDLHLVDCRTWQPRSCIPQMHTDEITRVRFVNEEVICSAGEDQMINFITTDPSVCEDDALLQATACGEVVTKMTSLNEVELMAMVGSCENGYVYPLDLEKTETRFPRPDFNTYLVDWCVLGGRLSLLLGHRDDDGNAGPLSLLDFETRTQDALRPMAHKELCRMAIGIGNRLITGGEDGVLAFWARDGTNSDSGGELLRTSAPQGGLPTAHPTAPQGHVKKRPREPFTNDKCLSPLTGRGPGKSY